MKDGVINRAGSLCKIRINVITGGVVLETNQRLNENKKEAMKEEIKSKRLSISRSNA